MALRWGDVPGENRPGSVPIATARGYGRTEPDFNDADERYNHPWMNESAMIYSALENRLRAGLL